MDILKTLSDAGFENAALLDPEKGLVRVRTAKGWAYERFKTEEQLASWVKAHEPEAKQ